MLFPSSHSSAPLIKPFPHEPGTAFLVQAEGLIESPPEQLQFGSVPIQLEAHPLLSFLLPSSHVSLPSFLPSPQTIGLQEEGEESEPPWQAYPGRNPWHPGAHPWLSAMSLSSQTSVQVTFLSPQEGIQLQFLVEGSNSNPEEKH